jgi:hypothetical protein
LFQFIVTIFSSHLYFYVGHVVSAHLNILLFFGRNVAGEYMHNDAYRDLFQSPEVFWVIKSRRVKWEGDVARVGGGGTECLQGFGDVTCLEKDQNYNMARI